MYILYITNLSENKWAGPNISVPAQIKAQALYDNVFLYNQNHIELEEWRQEEYFHNLNDFPTQKLKDLPTPFNCPDLIIFEGMYQFGLNKILKDIKKFKIPYIIIPRSELTKQAQRQNALKKKIANSLYFYKFTTNASAIQYLTQAEKKDSGEKWNKNYFVIPNGISQKKNIKLEFNNQTLKLVYIGRLDMYHKGLDLMIEGVKNASDIMREHSVKLHLYGPDRNNTIEQLKKTISENRVNDIILIHDSVFGEEKEQVLLNSDAFIMTSRFEGHPMGLIEALSYGLPCLVSTGTNMREEIKSFDAGWVCDVNPMSIEVALRNLVCNKIQLKEKSENALELSEKYNWDALAKLSSAKYSQILNASS